MYSDTLADMLTRIRNGSRARLERVEIPNSKLKVRLAEVLKKEGYIEDFRVMKDLHQGILEVKLKYGGRPSAGHRRPPQGEASRATAPTCVATRSRRSEMVSAR